MKEELKALLIKYNATISIETEGEGYSQTSELVIEINSGYSDFKSEVIGIYGNEITKFNL
jgi:hypothetical protein